MTLHDNRLDMAAEGGEVQEADISLKLNAECDSASAADELPSAEQADENAGLDGRPPLPSGLQLQTTKQYLAAAAATLLTIVMVVVYRTPQCLIGFVIAGTLVYLAEAIKYDYYDGKISELCLLCASITPLHLRSACRVVFRTQDEIPKYYEFIVPGKNHERFMLNHVYLVYFREHEPQHLMGFTQL